MSKAIWNDVVIADSEETIVVEGNHYFPIESVDERYLVESGTHTLCPWKGLASYYSLEVDGRRNQDAAWYYPRPSPLARKIKGRVAFWHGVEITDNERDASDSGSRSRGLLATLLGRV
jgi:uncharacterized protein (DUF427 family)